MKLWSYKRGHAAKNKRLPLFTYLAYLLVTTTIFTGVTLSGYISRSTATDTAKVAYVIVQASGQTVSSDNIVDAANENDSFQYNLTVSNEKDGKTSEVALNYVIYIDLPDDIPDGLQISVSDTTGGVITTNSTQNQNTLTFSSTKILPAGVTTMNTHTIMIKGTDQVDDERDNLTVNVAVRAEQID